MIRASVKIKDERRTDLGSYLRDNKVVLNEKKEGLYEKLFGRCKQTISYSGRAG